MAEQVLGEPVRAVMLGRIFGAEKVRMSNPFSSVTAGLAIRASGIR